jgi:DNA-binding CsgD family transcriptional regulator
VTARQSRVIELIAAGGTNKEIAHQLGITERGVAAHITRLLARFHTTNRAGLVASALSPGAASQAITPPPMHQSLASLEFSAFDDSQLLVTITLGRDQVVAYQNRSTRLLMSGVAQRSMLGHAGGDRFPHETAVRVRQVADDALTGARTLTIEAMPLRWQNDDGSWDGRVFDFVLQPLVGTGGRVEGILWVGTCKALVDES